MNTVYLWRTEDLEGHSYVVPRETREWLKGSHGYIPTVELVLLKSPKALNVRRPLPVLDKAQRLSLVRLLFNLSDEAFPIDRVEILDPVSKDTLEIWDL